MAQDVVSVRIQDGFIQLVSVEKSPIFGWQHSVYFVNVLGFSKADEEPILQLKEESNVLTRLQECISYLEENKINFVIDKTAEKLLKKAISEHKKLDESRKLGKHLKENPITEIEVPNFNRTLKPYQIPAVAHLINIEGAANFSVPGSGKTTIVLAAFSILKNRNEIDRIVVIGPRACFRPWEEEYKACFGKEPKVVRITGAKADRPALYHDALTSDLIMLSYQMAANEQAELKELFSQSKILLVLDESHNIKRLEGGRWADALLSLAPFAKRRIALSGTPIPNTIHDIWSQVAFLWPNEPVLGEREHFKYQADNNSASLEEQIHNELSPLYWRIHKRDLKLPKPRFHRIKVKLNPYQSAIYEAIAAKVLSEVISAPDERASLRIWRKARLVRLLQAASNPSLLKEYSPEFRIPPLEGSGISVTNLIEHYSDYEIAKKISATEKLVRKLVLEKKEKVVIWSSFVHNITVLQKRLEDLNPVIIHGGIPKDATEDDELNRESIIHDFKNRDTCMVLIANPGACAESISLHKVCLHAIYLDRTLNGAHYMQSMDRIHRVGLEEKDIVHYWIIQAKNTIDEVIDQRLEEKRKRMLKILDENFSVLNLDSEEDAFSEELDEDKDFAAVIDALKKETGGNKK
ncbi:MAG: DEAD/DEAH box helicase [archaeon]|jgi:SNF2 family DNA or RNA helicase